MMKKRNFLFLAAMTAMVFSLAAGCGQRGSGDASGSDASAQSSVSPKYETSAGSTANVQTEQTTLSQDGADGTQTRVQQESTGQTQNADIQVQTVDGQDTAITGDEAKAAALADAGIDASEVTHIRVKKDWDDGRNIYEVEFYVGREEYDYDIDADTGVILSKDYDIDDDFYNGQNGQGTGSDGNIISEDEAVRIVLDRVDGAAASDVWMKLDYDDGRAYYEGEIYYNNTEYEFEMNAATGEILEWSEEHYGR